MTTSRRTSRSRARRGLSLVEVMISLSISTMLLVAVCGAFVASVSVVEANDQFFRASQTARVTMSQMLTEIRRAESVQCSAAAPTHFEVIRPAEMLTPNEVYRKYAYSATTRQLTLQIFYANDVAGPSYVLATNVESMAFGPPQMGTDSNNANAVQRIPVTASVKVGKHFITLNGAAGPRRALRY